MKRIDQVTVGFRGGDAISRLTLSIRQLLRSWGFDSEIFADFNHVARETGHLCFPIEKLGKRNTDLLIYHFSIGSSVLGSVLAFEGPKVMIYHNITPPHYFSPYNLQVARRLQDGRNQLRRASHEFDLALAVSEFNRRELESLGYARTAVLPFFLPSRNEAGGSGFERPRFIKPDLATLLFVGRLAPNKKAEELLKIFGIYQKFYNPESQLIWVGSWGGVELYHLELTELVNELGLRDVVFAGPVDEQTLHASYAASDLLTCTSEHEGVCVPVLESFQHGLPVIAFSDAALPETVGAAGILVPDRDHALFAESIHRILNDSELRAELVRRGKARLESLYSPEKGAKILREVLEGAGTPQDR